MQVPRANELLQGLSNRSGYAGTPAETGDLAADGLVEAYRPEQQADLAAARGQLSQVAARVRELRRAADATHGPRVPSSGDTLPPVGPHAELLQQLETLESLSRQVATLDALVPDATGGYLRLTTAGRRAVTKLSVWQSRFAAVDLTAFLDALDQTDEALKSAIQRAKQIFGALENREEAVAWQQPGGLANTGPEVDASSRTQTRGVALALVKTPRDASGLLEEYIGTSQQLGQDGLETADRELVAGMLVAGPFGGGGGLTRFRALRDSIAGALGTSAVPRQSALAAAVLSDLPATVDGWIGTRFAQVSQGIAIADSGPLELGILTRAPYAVPVVLTRFATAMEMLGKAGYNADLGASTAAALLAASPHPVDRFGPRFAYLDARLHDIVGTPAAPAMLAATPLAPEEAWDFFQATVAAITRGSYFDVTSEIDYLALILGVDPGPFLTSAMSPGAVIPVAEVPPSASLANASYFAYQQRVFPTYVFWAAAHPVHFHAVPAFG